MRIARSDCGQYKNPKCYQLSNIHSFYLSIEFPFSRLLRFLRICVRFGLLQFKSLPPQCPLWSKADILSAPKYRSQAGPWVAGQIEQLPAIQNPRCLKRYGSRSLATSDKSFVTPSFARSVTSRSSKPQGLMRVKGSRSISTFSAIPW